MALPALSFPKSQACNRLVWTHKSFLGGLRIMPIRRFFEVVRGIAEFVFENDTPQSIIKARACSH